jgi:formate hydrogenlyase subunit 3/multisubunit Na+/H+ antiporter MnhD subunit
MTLSTPVLWVVIPLIVALISLIFQKKIVANVLLTGLTTLALALLAAFFPEDYSINLGFQTIIFTESLGILGRQITIPYEILPFLTFIFAMNFLWIVTSMIPGVPAIFRGGSMAITALLTAALGVEPFLYAALLIEAAVLVSIPILSPLKESTNPGILRYLSLQSLALPPILLAGWLLAGVEALPPDSPLIGQSLLLLGLGFAILLSVFPFHSWMPMVSQKSHPISVSYLLFIMPTIILIFSLNFFERYIFLRTYQGLYEILRVFGGLMIVIGGAFTAAQTNLKRAFGFLVMTETGFSLLAIGLMQQGGLSDMLALLPVHAMGYLLWAFCTALIENNAGSTQITTLRGFARHYPMLSLGLLLAQFSIAGLPLLASFPIKSAILSAVLQVNRSLGIWGLIGSIGPFFFTLRLLVEMIMPINESSAEGWSRFEKPSETVPILVLIFVLLLLGLFPHVFLVKITQTLNAFLQLQ